MKEKTPELGPTGRVLRLLCDISGWSAGILLILMATMTVISVIGRAWFDSPIEGDVKLVQLGIAVCISACLPYAQFHRSNTTVDSLTPRASRQPPARLDLGGTLCYSLVLAVMAWRVAAGGYAVGRRRL